MIEEEFKNKCNSYTTREGELTPAEALTMLTEAYMEQCGISMTYRTLVEGASWYWQKLLGESEHELAKIAKKKSFTGLMPYLSKEFNERKEHYWEYDICNLESGDAVEAAKSFLEDYEDDRFRIAFCRGFIHYVDRLKNYEAERDEILRENPHLTVFRGLDLDQLSAKQLKTILGNVEKALKSMVGDMEPTQEYIDALDDIEKKKLEKLMLQRSVLLTKLGENLPVMFYLHGYSDIMMDPFAKQFIEQFSGRYRIIVHELNVDPDKSLSILNELISKEHPQMIIAKGEDAYNAMRCERGEEVDVIAMNPFLGAGLDEMPVWKFENVFALCSARDELYGEAYISTIKEKYPDIHLTESKTFGHNLNKRGFKQLCRLVRTVAKYRKQCDELMSLAEYEDMVRNRPKSDTSGYYSLKIWSYDKSWQWKDEFSREVVDKWPSYRRRISCRQVEFATKDEALEAMQAIVISDNSNICAFIIERLPFGIISTEPLWLEAWSYDSNGNLIQEASCSAAHVDKPDIYGKFFGHLPEEIKWHKGDIVQIFHHYHGDPNTYATLGLVNEVPESTEEVYKEYLYSSRQFIVDGNPPNDWFEKVVFEGVNDDEMFIQFGPYCPGWHTCDFYNPMRVLPAPENLSEDIISELKSWQAEWLRNEE